MNNSQITTTFVQQYFHPDVSAVAQLLGQAFSAMHKQKPDWSLRVVCSDEIRPEERRSLGALRFVDHKICRTAWIGNSLSLQRVLKAAWFHLYAFLSVCFGTRHQIVVALTTPPFIGFTISLACRIRRIPFVYYVEDLFPEILLDTGILHAPHITKKSAFLNRMTLHRARVVVTIGRYVSRKLWLNYNIHPGKVMIVENWSSQEFDAPVSPPHGLSFAYTGNFGFAHEFHLLRLLLQSLSVESPSLMLVGGGKRAKAAARATQMIPGVDVQVSGYVSDEDHRRCLLDSSFLIVSQDYRTVGDLVPSKIYTYTAAAKPVVFFGPRQCEIGEAITEYRLGVVIETAADIQDAAEVLLNLAWDASAYKQVSRRVFSYYEANGGVRRAAAQLVSILEQIDAT